MIKVILNRLAIGIFAYGCLSNSFANPPQIAVLPLSPHGIDSSDASIITDAISNSLVSLKTVRVMERQQINTILNEQGFEESGACDASECAIKAGKLLGIEQIIVGSIGKLGNSYVLNLRRVDIASGEVISTSMQQQNGEIEGVLQNAIPKSISDLLDEKSKKQQQVKTIDDKSNKKTVETGIPILMDVPFLGYLFKSSKTVEVDSNK